MNIESILSQLPGIVFWKDLDSHYMGANDTFHKLAGFNNKTISGKTDFDMPWDTFADKYRDDDRQASLNGGIKTLEFVPTCKGNVMGIVEKRPIVEHHKTIGVSCRLTPITGYQDQQALVLPKKSLKSLFCGISEREAEILYYFVRGFSMRQIGNMLYISPKTVETHINNIKLKFSVANKCELINLSINLGFLNCIPASLV